MFLPQKELIAHLVRVREETGQMASILRGMKGPPQAPAVAAPGKQSPSEPVIAPRLRIEDLKPPPAKRQKQNPGSGSPVRIKTEVEPSPQQTKRPVPKRRRKPTNSGMPLEPIDVDVATSTPVDLTVSPVQAADTSLPAATDNVLGVKLEQDAQADPVTYLANQWKRLEGVLSRRDQSALDNVNADLEMDLPVPFDDSLATFTVRMRAARAARAGVSTAKMPMAPPAVAEGFDYSAFIDFSALDDDGDDESAPTVIAATPDLLGPGDPRFEVSPSSEGATGTPRHVAPIQPIHHRAPIGTVSPVQQHVDLFGEDGWLTEGLDEKWDEGFDPNPSHWNLASV